MSDRKQTAFGQIKKSADAASALAAKLAKDDAFADALSDLAILAPDSPDMARAIADPKKFLEDRKVTLPADSRVKMDKSFLNVTVEICANGHCITIVITI
jgi:F0F1-type ATP synthase delta subunit